MIGDRFSIENGQVGERAFGDDPPIGQTKTLGRIARHFVDGLFQCVQFQIADQWAEESSCRTEDSRMHRAIAAVDPVGPHHEKVVLQKRVNEPVVALVKDQQSGQPLFDEQVKQCLGGRKPRRVDELAKRFPLPL